MQKIFLCLTLLVSVACHETEFGGATNTSKIQANDAKPVTPPASIAAPKVEAPKEDGDKDACRTAGKGKILVANDEWQFSDTGFQHSPDAAKFAQNIAVWLGACGNRTFGTFHAYSHDFSLTEPQLANTLKAQGHKWTSGTDFAVTLENLRNYDWIFLAGDVSASIDADVFAEYVRQGGGLYIAAGTGSNAVAEASRWNPILNEFGLQYASSYNKINLVVPIESVTHPIFAGVTGLYQNNGNSISLTPNASPKAKILVQYNGQGMYAIYDGSL